MPRLQLAVNTCFAGKFWPEPAAWLALVREWELDAVQFSLDLLDPQMPGALELAAQVRRAAAAHDVKIGSTFTGSRAYLGNMLLHPTSHYRSWAADWLRRAVDVTAVLGARATGGHIGAHAAGRSAATPSLEDELISTAVDLGHRAARAGLEYLMLELMPGPGEVPAGPGQALAMLEWISAGSPVPYYLCLDLGHACGPAARDGARPDLVYEWLEELGPITRCVHLQQTDGLGDRHWPFTEAHQAQGVIQPGRVLRALRGFRLPEVDLVLELAHPPEATPERVAADWAESVLVWRRALEEEAKEVSPA